MKRALAFIATLLLLFLVAVPAAFAADDSLPHSGRVLIATEGDLTVPAGDQADFVLVTRGTATIEGTVNTVVVVDGTARFEGARIETVVAIRTPVTVGAGTVVVGEVLKLDSDVTRVGDARINGGVRDIGLDLAGVGLFLGPALVLVYIGFAIASVAAGLLLAGLAARQVRIAERAISREPITVFLAGIAGVFLPILLAVALFVTIVGAPLGFGLLVFLLPTAAFVGYLIAGIWIGDWVLARMTPGRERARPYLAAVIGIVLLQLLGIWPLVSGIASLFGYGALVLVAWRTLNGSGGRVVAPGGRPAPALQAG